jgi:MFS family permease
LATWQVAEITKHFAQNGLFLIAASVVNISQVLGSILTGSLAGAIGRKKVVLLSNIFIIVGWAFIGFSDGDFSLIMTGRIIHGAVFLASVSQVYLAEIADSKRR